MVRLAFLLLLASSVFSDETEHAFLPSAKRVLQEDYYSSNSDFYGSFEFLYWEGTERGLEYALKNRLLSFDQSIQIYQPAFAFEPAFRIALGSHLPHDDWDLELAYTRFYTHTDNRAHHDFGGNPTGGIRAVWTSSVAFQGNNGSVLWQNAEAQWKIHANLFDLTLKTQLYLTPAMIIVPTFGLKMGLLQQQYKVLYENGNTVNILQGRVVFPIQFINSSVSMKNRSFNLGPTSAFATRWKVGDHFEFLGSLSGSLLASRFHVGRNESDVSFNSLFDSLEFDSLRESDQYWTFRPQAAIQFGFGWTDFVYRPRSVLQYGFSAAYEAQVWWKQNMLFRFIDQTNAAMIAPTQGNLYFHGLNIELFVDF